MPPLQAFVHKPNLIESRLSIISTDPRGTLSFTSSDNELVRQLIQNIRANDGNVTFALFVTLFQGRNLSPEEINQLEQDFVRVMDS